MSNKKPISDYERKRKNAKQRETYRLNIERERLRGKIWRENNKEKCRQRHIRNWTPQKSRKTHLKRKYGINQEIYESMIVNQKNMCKSCGDSFEEKNIHIDHCHESNKVRGLLCSQCNMALGLMKDDPERILALYNYSLAYC